MRALIATLVAALCPAAAHAAIFTVDTTSANASLSACTAAAGDCSLAGAIAAANAAPDADTLHFAIPTSEPGCTAAPPRCVLGGTHELAVNQPLVIDGFTQPGARPNTIAASAGGLDAVHTIQLDMALRFNVPGTVRGLLLSGSANNSVYPLLYAHAGPTTEPMRVEGVHIGESFSGTAGVTWGIVIATSQPVQIGGLDPAQRNLFCRAGAALVNHTNTSRLSAQGNLFGVDADGVSTQRCFNTLAVDGAYTYTDAEHLVFGGSAPDARNVVAGRGVDVSPRNVAFSHNALADVRIQGNHFGLGADGVTPLPLHFAVRAVGVSGLMVGGDGPGEGNWIVGPLASALPAIQIIGQGYTARGAVLGNEFVGITGKPWYRESPAMAGPLSRTPNDAGDADGAPGGRNGGLQNHPDIVAFAQTPAGLEIGYRVDSPPQASAYPLTIEFFLATGAGPDLVLGRDIYTAAEAQTVKTITLPMPAGGWPGNGAVIASATTAMPAAPSSRESSEIGWHPVTLAFAPGTAPTTPRGQAKTVTVIATSSAPFAPRGPVRIDYRSTSYVHAYCDTTLSATGPSTAQATCTLPAMDLQQAHILEATLDSRTVPFAAPSGDNPAVQMAHAFVEPPSDDLFKDGFED